MKKTKTPTKKWAEALNKHFFQRGNADGQKAHEKMLNITNQQRNANQNHNVLSPHSAQMVIIKNTNRRLPWQSVG